MDDTDVRIDVDVDEDRVGRFTGLLGRMGRMAGPIAGVAATVGKATAAFGAAVPAAAAVVTTLENVAPAAGVAVTGMVAVQLASGAVKLAAVGMQDALTAALDPSKTKDFQESLKKLSPEARKFATTIHEAAPGLHRLQQSVQDRVFKGLGDQLERTSKSVLPVLRTNLLSSAASLNTMGSGVLTAARGLGESGTLGKALGSASTGLKNFSGLPAVAVTALGQIAAAAGPSFEALTAKAGAAGKGIGDRLSKAFASGSMQAAIEKAIGLLGQLFTVGANVGHIIGGIFNAVPAGGGGLITVLRDVTGEIAKIINSKGIQTALRTLFQTMATVGATVAPLLGQALSGIAPVITALGPPIQKVVTALGAGLKPIIGALGPVLTQAAGAVGSLLTALAPLLPVIGQLVAALLPAITPLLAAFSVAFRALAPVVQQVAGILQATLAPILAALPSIVEPLAALIADRLVFFLTLLGKILVQLAPSLISLGTTIGALMTALAPVIEAFAQLQEQLFSALMPVLTKLISVVGSIVSILTTGLAAVLMNTVVPAVQVVAALLRGDWSQAWEIAKTAALNAAQALARYAIDTAKNFWGMIQSIVGYFQSLPGRVQSATAGLPAVLQGAANRAGAQLVAATQQKIAAAVATIHSLPSRAQSALAGSGNVLYNAGVSVIRGFIAGVESQIGALASKLASITDMIPKVKGPPAKDAKLLTPAGRLIIEGLIRGIDETTAKLRSRLASITKALPANVKSGYGRTLARATAELQKEVTKRDGVLKNLAAAQKKLDDLVKARSKASSDISSGILSEADITSGHADVNSVSAITVGLQQALKASKAFETNMAALRKAGLRSDLLQEIADKGVSGGAATAAALAKATPAELKRINDLQAQLAKSALATGATVGDALYGAGIRAAQGLVAGLKSQEKAIEAQMRKIAEQMLKTVKAVHKTKSPSRAFHAIGVMDMEGWRGGVVANAARVIAAARDTARGVLDAASGVGGALASVPTSGQLAGAYGVAGGGDQHNTINLYSTEATPDGMLRALSWQGLVGGR
ncbi:hypothetical protein [Streptomyces sp. LUP30]|uniref:hypothetical protein n=1 Tax=Streptomyces sp. LUP30 TaxID=1890285 RepID=UPI00114D0310|nr:hypothetical protein [Streptomyces sp. LUP30]